MSDDYDDATDLCVDCPRCGCCGLMLRTCWQCGGDGETEPGELYDQDPLWYDPDETAPCHVCGGAGHFKFCAGGCDKGGKHAGKKRMA
jgi:hypothetical protein